ncbi:hypothetical protein P389DRAFT_20495 [Cystobasidium minutum MCA 4210]|uniref:uncharacterized protein n=1 Tax=Cystobasidium minutum MCA 4210 TaxID=1397322 RepID=UPI0034CF47B8|eukprot:jgi/Rhomi1/20495/CE20494_16615
MNNNIDNGSRSVGAALYYGITALVVVGIAIAVIAGKFFYRRKAQKEIRRRNDLERQEAIRRGEAGGLPTYYEYPNTIPLNVPTLAYPDAARRANGDTAPTAQGMQDPSLPSYDASAPPKYEYATGAAGAAAAAGGAIQRAASSIRQALSRPASLRRNDSSATTATTRNATTTTEPEMQEMTSTSTPSTRVMTAAPVMHVVHTPSNLSRSQSTTSVNTMRTARSTNATPVPTPAAENSTTPREEERMETVPLEDERSNTQRSD